MFVGRKKKKKSLVICYVHCVREMEMLANSRRERMQTRGRAGWVAGEPSRETKRCGSRHRVRIHTLGQSHAERER